MSLAQQLLPRVKGRRTQAVGDKTTFFSNMFAMSLKNQGTTIYQYVFEVEPAIAHDST